MVELLRTEGMTTDESDGEGEQGACYVSPKPWRNAEVVKLLKWLDRTHTQDLSNCFR